MAAGGWSVLVGHATGRALGALAVLGAVFTGLRGLSAAPVSREPTVAAMPATAPSSAASSAPKDTSILLAGFPLLAGLTLSDSQAPAITAIRSRARQQALLEHPVLQNAIEAILRGTAAHDTAAVLAARLSLTNEQQQIAQLLAQERSAIRAVLTTAQQSLFDQNLAAEAQRTQAAPLPTAALESQP